ncbi:hypothetical protein FRC16_002111 [Serendipita sp. 398]|nr:hypothetical protein FRC16_002111 [Serendipita sp. 398]
MPAYFHSVRLPTTRSSSVVWHLAKYIELLNASRVLIIRVTRDSARISVITHRFLVRESPRPSRKSNEWNWHNVNCSPTNGNEKVRLFFLSTRPILRALWVYVPLGYSALNEITNLRKITMNGIHSHNLQLSFWLA